MIVDARYLKSTTLFLRIRNLGQYWDFHLLQWSDTESNNTKIILTEYIDSSPDESYYAANIYTPPNGPWAIETIEASSGRVLFVGDTDDPVSSRLPTNAYIAPNNATITAIKTKTDQLPVNPLLASDSRLNNLNFPISVLNSQIINLQETMPPAPDNTSIARIKAQTDKLTFTGNNINSQIKGSDNLDFTSTQLVSLLAAGSTVTLTPDNLNALVSQIISHSNLGNLVNLDVRVSSRVASNDPRLDNLDAKLSTIANVNKVFIPSSNNNPSTPDKIYIPTTNPKTPGRPTVTISNGIESVQYPDGSSVTVKK